MTRRIVEFIQIRAFISGAKATVDTPIDDDLFALDMIDVFLTIIVM